ncbi:DUF1778 domain-containing protein [Mariprofundus erugo]|uniref:DUF1778 domain-containing protein n=1 Tax=Mariprofundus erugo TaxID=2528639 RepID=A0A5R9H3M1_9PROT|nr:DUF1778 domain-containing protein [Mariprofundus erugo]TLS69224.1 DUF1778 domain-containing protein [Mariprofundus erugo]TLS72801.1 DUF1778 domain-containing protein [Mariprofundus erugo]
MSSLHRISARVSEENRALVHQAADLAGLSVADFLIAAALEEAHRIIEREQTVTISRSYARSFFAALDNPPQPNAALIAAVREYRNN